MSEYEWFPPEMSEERRKELEEHVADLLRQADEYEKNRKDES